MKLAIKAFKAIKALALALAVTRGFSGRSKGLSGPRETHLPRKDIDLKEKNQCFFCPCQSQPPYLPVEVDADVGPHVLRTDG